MITAKRPAESDAKEVVLAFLKALNDEDFDTAKKYLSDDMKFEGVLGTRDGAKVYIADMSSMKFKYGIKKAFADGDDVCILYDIAMSGQTIFSCGWYCVGGGQISSIRVVFDPRPLLEQQRKK
ncbi:MAG TPA: nuclear transport factor 2 family protein [Mucilaginibacter sp.]|jgi:limonene-1,2-epoxide hydrolase